MPDFSKYCEITKRQFVGSGFDTYIFTDEKGIRYHVAWETIQKVCQQGFSTPEIHNYVIETKYGFVKRASIWSLEGEVSINKAKYTKNLQEACVYSQADYEDDIKAWEIFLDGKENEDFKFKEIELKFKL